MNEEYLIKYLKEKNKYYNNLSFNLNDNIRALMNITMPYDLSDEFYKKQDEYLKYLTSKKKIINVDDLKYKNNISLFLGDITSLKADVIVNAGNSELLGCFSPLHKCIDNQIHSFAGLEVRRDLMKILNGRSIKNAEVVVTKGYNLPSKYIIHTVGPIYQGIKQDDIDLRNCYINSLNKVKEMHLKNIVFCSLSTGLYGFPIERASKIAIKATKEFLKDNEDIKVIFDVFSNYDYRIYEEVLNDN